MTVLLTGQNRNWKSRCRKLNPVSPVQSLKKSAASMKDPNAQARLLHRSLKAC